MDSSWPKRYGFTLIELMLVVIIIGVLAAIVTPRFIGRDQEAKIAAAKANITNISIGLDMFGMDMGSYPDSLSELMVDPGSDDKWRGRYLNKAPDKDPWGNPYIYEPETAEGGYRLCSEGPDKEGSLDDICN
ncbi:MAG: type II secretion system major pseudopilin GspG [Candidatus Omnitrophica bacterium]|nr:type II secretion system major pseudopilin GspG [Candidatus Omnitrophota bacterium]